MKKIVMLLSVLFLTLVVNVNSQNEFYADGEQVKWEYEIIFNDSLKIEFGIKENIIIIKEKNGFVIVNNSFSILSRYKISYKDILLIKKDINKPLYLLSMQYDEDYNCFVIDDYEEKSYVVAKKNDYLKIFRNKLKEKLSI